ncbi:hypothetical protein ACGYJ7_04790, partial [Sulfitobacter sp. M22298]
MADENTPDLQDRLSTFSQKNKTKRRGGNIGVGALAIALALGGGGAAYFLATNLQERAKGLETSDVETFQDQRTGNGGRFVNRQAILTPYRHPKMTPIGALGSWP